MKDRSEEQRKAALPRLKIRASEKKRHEWAVRIWRTYELTPEDVGRQWEMQHGKCRLCEQPLDSKRVWVIDHDHKSGFFRGLLHAWCNHRVLSMIERAGFTRTYNALGYLWPLRCRDMGCY